MNGAKRHAARGEATRLLGRFGGMLLQEKKLNGAIWCVLENILLKFGGGVVIILEKWCLLRGFGACPPRF